MWISKTAIDALLGTIADLRKQNAELHDRLQSTYQAEAFHTFHGARREMREADAPPAAAAPAQHHPDAGIDFDAIGKQVGVDPALVTAQ